MFIGCLQCKSDTQKKLIQKYSPFFSFSHSILFSFFFLHLMKIHIYRCTCNRECKFLSLVWCFFFLSCFSYSWKFSYIANASMWKSFSFPLIAVRAHKQRKRNESNHIEHMHMHCIYYTVILYSRISVFYLFAIFFLLIFSMRFECM